MHVQIDLIYESFPTFTAINLIIAFLMFSPQFLALPFETGGIALILCMSILYMSDQIGLV